MNWNDTPCFGYHSPFDSPYDELFGHKEPPSNDGWSDSDTDDEEKEDDDDWT